MFKKGYPSSFQNIAYVSFVKILRTVNVHLQCIHCENFLAAFVLSNSAQSKQEIPDSVGGDDGKRVTLMTNCTPLGALVCEPCGGWFMLDDELWKIAETNEAECSASAEAFKPLEYALR